MGVGAGLPWLVQLGALSRMGRESVGHPQGGGAGVSAFLHLYWALASTDLVLPGDTLASPTAVTPRPLPAHMCLVCYWRRGSKSLPAPLTLQA